MAGRATITGEMPLNGRSFRPALEGGVLNGQADLQGSTEI